MSQPLGEYVSFVRKKRGLTQKDLADKLGYTIQSISRFEQGEMQLALIVMPDLATLLGVSLDDLFARKIPAEPLAKPNPRLDQAVLCANLISLRQSHRYSQDKEAELLGISARSVANYEQGETIPPFDITEKILGLYKIKPSTLFYENVDAPALSKIKYVDPAKQKRRRTFIAIGSVFCVAVIALGGTEPLWFPLLGIQGQKASSSAEAITRNMSTSWSLPGTSSSTTSSKDTSSRTSSSKPSSSTPPSSSSSSSAETSSERSDMNAFIPGLKNFYVEPDNTAGWPNAVTPGTYVFHFVFDPTSFTVDSFPDSKYTHGFGRNGAQVTPFTITQSTEQVALWEWTLTISDTAFDGYGGQLWASIQRIGGSSNAFFVLNFVISNPSNPA
jgi:transcriptional regulator with XRE-family HTH domain